MSRPDGDQQRFLGVAKRISPGQRIASAGRPAFAWHRPEAQERYVGHGVAARLTSSQGASVLGDVERAQVQWLDAAPGSPGPWFGGFAFDPRRNTDDRWHHFSAAQWVLPEVAIAETAQGAWLVAFASSEAEARARLASVELRSARAERTALPPVQTSGEDRGAWSALMARALEAIRSGRLQKVVLARPIAYRADGEVDCDQLFGVLAERHPRCAAFLFRTEAGDAFVGASPETLLRREGGLLHVDALAGTLAPGAETATEKERHEHALVVDGIRAALHPLCAWIEADVAPSLHVVGPLAHLKTRVVARLREGVGTHEVASALHPTPALGGTPRDAALEFLRGEEGFDRGWYGGAIGWMGAHAAHLAVAIRATLVTGGHGTAFVGAGIVAGSDADAEWAETARKSQAVLGAFGGAA